MRRMLVFGQLFASISFILVMLTIGSESDFVGVRHIGAVILRCNFLVNFYLR